MTFLNTLRRSSQDLATLFANLSRGSRRSRRRPKDFTTSPRAKGFILEKKSPRALESFFSEEIGLLITWRSPSKNLVTRLPFLMVSSKATKKSPISAVVSRNPPELEPTYSNSSPSTPRTPLTMETPILKIAKKPLAVLFTLSSVESPILRLSVNRTNIKVMS